MKNDYLIIKDLKNLIDDNACSENDIAKYAGVSLRTITNILSNSVLPTDEVVDKLYSYIFEKGYRLNKIKEEIFKETNSNLILFHGASKTINEVKYNGSRDNCDFGSGFYLGESYFQASSFVYDVPYSSIYAFSLNLDDLNIVKFDCNVEWMIAVCYFRKMLSEYKEHKLIQDVLRKIENADVIIAPIADNKMFNIMRQFGDGEITDIQAIHSLASSGLGNQYVLKTPKAISKLNEIERMFLSTSERKSINLLMEERSKEIDTKLKISKREFRGEGQYIDELFK